MIDDIVEGLRARPRRLPAALLYDALGSALFDAITLLPEYGVARAGARVLVDHLDDVLDAVGPVARVIELGPGSGAAAAVVMRGVAERVHGAEFVGIDVSDAALDRCTRAVGAVDGVTPRAVVGDWFEGLGEALDDRPEAAVLVLFLGSTLSNFDRAEVPGFLARLRGRLRAGDTFLLAFDLPKSVSMLLAAYDDALGVTAAFNRNVLVRLNREHGASLPLDAFRHEARWQEAGRRVEMHLVATREVRAEVLGVDVTLTPGETLWTESSHRYAVDEVTEWARDAGFRPVDAWVDEEWPFAQVLLRAVGPATPRA